jgi:hypothetical protein
MDTAVLSAASALAGSLFGGASTLGASWLTQRSQRRAQAQVYEAAKRETLYAEFISEAARRLAEAWSRQAEGPEVIAGLYGAVQRMRLTSSQAVIHAAENVLQLVIEAYAAPDHTFAELRVQIAELREHDRLREFSTACRAELVALHS